MSRLFLVLSIATIGGCSGQIGDTAPETPPPPTVPPPPDTPAPPADLGSARWAALPNTTPGAMRRLTNTEIEAMVTELVGEHIGFTDGFPPEERVGGFENNAAALTFPPTLFERAFDAARRAGEIVASNPAPFAPCAADTRNRACGEAVVRRFAERAWRRPLDDEDLTPLMASYDVGEDQGGFELGLTLAVQATLLSAPFFYLVEDVREEVKPGLLALSGAERANRLAFFLWRGPPDDALRAAADAGDLDTPEGVEAQAQRMLDRPQAQRSITEFHRQWLELERMTEVNKDLQYFPNWTDEIPGKMRTELDHYLEQTAIVEDSVEALLTARYSFQDETLRRYYQDGVTLEANGFDRVDLPPRRSGLLARGGFLIMEGFDQTSPVLRGLFIREKFLCGELPPPPDFVDDIPSDPTPAETTRERAEAHANDPLCRGCHQFMDPIGFGLERFDAAGRWRDMESSHPIDDRGEVVESDIGVFQGAAELGAKLAKSEYFRACFVRKWFRFAIGRMESKADLPTLQALDAMMATTDSYRALQLALTQTDAFLYRRAEDAR
ncbi:MAG: DUF1592 domain-containing protein [Myxococcota bacterium]